MTRVVRGSKPGEPALTIVCLDPVCTGLLVRQAVAQTASMVEIQDAAGTVLGGLRYDGTPFGCWEKVEVMLAAPNPELPDPDFVIGGIR